MLERAEDFRRVRAQEPALEPLIAQLKHGPWWDALLKEWSEHSASSDLRSATSLQRPATSVQRAGALIQVLQRTMVRVSQHPVSPFWASNAGRGVGRHSGGVLLLKQLGLASRSTGAGSLTLTERARDDEATESRWRVANVSRILLKWWWVDG